MSESLGEEVLEKVLTCGVRAPVLVGEASVDEN
jgi:hypothetical protein